MLLRFLKTIFLVVVVGGVTHAGEEISTSLDEYHLARGDMISITVFGEPDLAVSNVYLPKDGMTVLPLIGAVALAGKTVDEAEKAVEDRYRDGYLINPQVTITIAAYRPFFVNGQVKKPGSYEYVQGLTVRQAIALAGGLTERASLRKIAVVREGSEGAIDVSDSLDASQINPGDVLNVGESLF